MRQGAVPDGWLGRAGGVPYLNAKARWAVTETRRYQAFLSYAHKDKAEAQALHFRLETFRTPRKLVGRDGLYGPVERRLAPIFRDRDELATGSALGPELQRALSNSKFLVVLCSPSSAGSHWVNEEIRFFRKVHGDERILAAIVAGDPGAEAGPGKEGCFPPALVEPPEGSSAPREPIAADFRPEGDGRRLAFRKLAAGMLGVGLDDLQQRIAQRRQKRIAQVAGAMGVLALAMGGLAIYAFQQEAIAEEQRAIAERERDTAAASLDYLVSIFEIANPATENPKTITALTILERGLEKLDSELAGRPEVQARLLGALGDVYANLGEVTTAQGILERAMQTGEAPREDRLQAQVALAELYYLKGESERAAALCEAVLAELAVGPPARNAGTLSGRSYEVLGKIKAYTEYDKQAGITLMQAALSSYESARDDQRFRLARAQATIGRMFSYANQHTEAWEYLNRALMNLRQIYGADHIDIANTLQNRALAELRAEQFSAAAETMSEALRSYERILEPSHPNRALASLLYGRILFAAGDFAASQTYLRQAAAGFEAAYGPNHRQIAITMIYLGQFQAEEGFTADAFESFDRAKAIYDVLYPPDHANHGDLMVYRSIAINAAGDRESARASCAEGLAIMEKSIPNDDSWLDENRSICNRL